jgi:hypothetical protein
MSKLKSILFALAFMFVGAPSTASTPAVNGASLIVADASMSSTERRVRDAAVRVFTHGGGHGSGSYIKHKDFLFILTAQHVADGPLYSDYRVKKGNETKTAVLVWSDKKTDMAVLMLKTEFQTITPMDYKTTSDIPEVGTEVGYSGYPSRHQLMSIRGRVAGYEEKDGAGTQIMLHTYGWFGCSGSVIYNKKAEIIGVLWGVDVEYYPGIAVVEEMIWVIPVQKLDMDKVVENSCKIAGVAKKSSRFCRR